MRNKRNLSYSEPHTEHMFAQGKERREYIRKIKKIVQDNSIERASEIIVDSLLLYEEELKAKSRKRRMAVLGGGITLFLIIGISLLLEYPLKQYALAYMTMMIGMGGEIALLLIGVYLSWPKGIHYRNPKQEGVFEAMFRLLKELGANFPKMTSIHLLMYLMFIPFLGGILAKVELGHNVTGFCQAGYYALADNGGSDTVVREETTTVNNTQVMREGSTGEVEQLDEGILITRLEMRLSSEDWNTVFFHGEYSINGLEGQEEINRVVLDKVKELASHKLENVFDKLPGQGGAPQCEKDKISNASVEEEYAKSFEDINRILDLRETINESYPKRSLTQLVANGYDKLARLEKANGANQNTIIFYYGQAIMNNLKCLEFAENTNKTIKEKLAIIAQLYRDIACVCSDSEEAVISLRLADAFQHASDQY